MENQEQKIKELEALIVELRKLNNAQQTVISMMEAEQTTTIEKVVEDVLVKTLKNAHEASTDNGASKTQTFITKIDPDTGEFVRLKIDSKTQTHSLLPSIKRETPLEIQHQLEKKLQNTQLFLSTLCLARPLNIRKAVLFAFQEFSANTFAELEQFVQECKREQ